MAHVAMLDNEEKRVISSPTLKKRNRKEKEEKEREGKKKAIRRVVDQSCGEQS